MAKKIYAGQSFLWQWLFTFWVLYCLICPFRIELYAAWETGYTYRKKITIQTANVDADLTAFPLLVYLDPTGSGASLAAKILDTGLDVKFTQSDGETDLTYEREAYSEAGGNSTGWFWVATNVADGDGESATDIYIYYGYADAGDGSGDPWDANFLGVWHLTNAYDTTPGEVLDYSGSGNHGVAVAASDQTTTGAIAYNCQEFVEENSDHLTIDDNDLDVAQNYTAEIFLKPTNLDTTSDGMSKWNVSGPFHMGQTNVSAGTWWFNADIDGTDHADTDEVDDTNWNHLAITYDGSDVYFYLNGVEIYTASDTGDADNYIQRINIGADNGSSQPFDGYIDEARFSDTPRAAAWTKFTAKNGIEADNGLTWGSEETESGSYIPKVIIITGSYVLPGFIFVATRRRKKKK